MAESLTGMLRIRSGQVQYRKLNGAQWRDLVPLNTLLALSESDAGGGTVDPPPTGDPDTGLLFEQTMTPDGRDLVGLDGWQDYGAAGSIARILGGVLQLRTSGPQSYNKPKLYRTLPRDVEVRGRVLLDIDDTFLVHARATADDLGAATGGYVDSERNAFLYCFDGDGVFRSTRVTRNPDGTVPFVIRYEGATITLNGTSFPTGDFYNGTLGGVSTEGTAKADFYELAFFAVP